MGNGTDILAGQMLRGKKSQGSGSPGACMGGAPSLGCPAPLDTPLSPSFPKVVSSWLWVLLRVRTMKLPHGGPMTTRLWLCFSFHGRRSREGSGPRALGERSFGTVCICLLSWLLSHWCHQRPGHQTPPRPSAMAKRSDSGRLSARFELYISGGMKVGGGYLESPWGGL